MDRGSIVVLYVLFEEVSNGKSRPVLVIEKDDQGIEFYKITSQYSTKSKAIQSQYYEIKEWKEAGLKKPSWIDIGKRLWVSLEKVGVPKKIGYLSTLDKEQLAEFIQQYYQV